MLPDDMESLAQVAHALTIPIATGERLTTKREFARAIAAGATILQPALGRSGGIWESRKIAASVEAANAQIAPHLYAGPVAWAANIQPAAAIPNLLMAQTIKTDFHARLIEGTIRVEEGFVRPNALALALALRWTRTWPALIPLPARACTSRCMRPRWTTAVIPSWKEEHRQRRD